MRLLAALLLFVSQLAAAQVVLDGRSDRIDLWPHVRALADPGATVSLDDALANPQRFGPPKGAYATMGMDKEVVWLRVPLQVEAGGGGEWIFDLDYPLIRHAEVYVVRDGKVLDQALLGDAYPFEARPMRGRTHAASFTLPENAALELVLRYQTPGAKISPITLARLPSFHARALREQMIQGAAACLGFFLLLFSVVQWIHLRENLYLKYALLVVCSTMFSVHFFGIGAMYLWTDLSAVQNHMAGIASLMAAAATALFVEDALANDLNKWLRRGLRTVFAIHVFATLAYMADLIDIQAVAVLMNTTGLAPAVMGMPGAIAKARRGDHVGHWFLAAWAGYFFASAVLVGVVRGRIGADFWTMHSFQIGATIDMLIFLRIALLRTATRHREAQRAAAERDALFSMAHSDALTGLVNRRGLAEALSDALGRTAPERIVAVYMLDLDGFKPVNDKHGHDAGDALLRVVAQRLRGSVKARDVVARLGGDEFVVMAEALPNESAANELGNKLVEAFHTPFSIGEVSCSVSATIGYALAPMDSMDPAVLLKTADSAMYLGKQWGKDRAVRVSSTTKVPERNALPAE